MSLILSGTDGLSDVDGTAATPAIRGTDANTGIFFPAAGTIAFAEGGAEAMRIDSSGNVGIGTAGAPLSRLDVAVEATLTRRFLVNFDDSVITVKGANNSSNPEALRFIGDGIRFNTGTSGSGTERVRIDSSGNLGIGTTETGVGKVNVQLAGAIVSGNTTGAAVGASSIFQLNNANGGATNSTVMLLGGATGSNAGQISSGIGFTRENENDWGTQLRFYTHQSTVDVLTSLNERARIDSSGNLLVGTTTQLGAEKLNVTGSVSNDLINFVNSNATPFGLVVRFSGASPNGTSNTFFTAADSTTTRATIRSNGGLANYSANNVNLSDERTKTEIVDAGNYLAKICAIPVRTFKYKDQTDDELNLGVIAQEVEAVAPELVDVSGFGDTPEDGVPLKAIYQTDLQYALMKCIQEQQALITQLTARITALEGA